jgi:hypothetical protein
LHDLPEQHAMPKGCTYDLLHDYIHHFVFHTSNRDAVDQCLQIYRRIVEQHNPDETLCVLIDVRPAGAPFLPDVFRRLQQLYAELYLPTIRVAYLYNDVLVLSMTQGFLNLLRLKARRQYFSGEGSHERALTWLMNEGDAL